MPIRKPCYLGQGVCFHRGQFVCFLAGLRKNYTEPISTKFDGKAARGPRKKRLDFSNPDHVTLGLWLRSDTVKVRLDGSLIVPSTRRVTLGDRAFPVADARAWNGLPSSIRAASSMKLFCLN